MWRHNSETDASGISGETEAGGRRRRGSRGWGPFSGGQLTAIILGITLAISFPVGAFAVVSGSNSFITDATSGTRAKVDAKNNLYTSVHDNSSGKAAKVDAKNNLYTTLHDAFSGLPAGVDQYGRLKVVSPPAEVTEASGQINVTSSSWSNTLVDVTRTVDSIHVDIYSLSGGGAVQFGLTLDGCATVYKTIDAVDPDGLGVTTLDYGSEGLYLDSELCVRNTSPGTVSAAVFIFWHV